MGAPNRYSLVGAVLVGLSLAGCHGAISDELGGGGPGASGGAQGTGGGSAPGAGGSRPGSGGSSGSGVTGGGGGGGVTTPSFPPGGPAPAAVPIRRLTNSEYVASVTDLFPGFTLPVVTFIPDSKVLGFVNLSSSQTSSLVRMEQYESAAQAIAQLVAADPTKLTGCNAATSGELACAQAYLYGLGKRAFRHSLSDAEKQSLTALLSVDQAVVDYPSRLGLAIEGVLLSPKFLFRPEIGGAKPSPSSPVLPLTPWETATRLSFLLTGSIPDEPLAAAADSGALSTVAELTAQTQRLLALPRARDNLVYFHTLWLGIDAIGALTKNQVAFPAFTAGLAAYMGQETRLFLNNVLFVQGGTFADLFLGTYTFANGPLAAFYGSPAPAVDWSRLELDPNQRAGLLTQGSLLATMAKEDRTDPVRRGKFVLERLLCRTVVPPSPDIVAKFQPLDLSKTARDQFTQHRNDTVCASCHNTLDPLGLPFEHYDATGQWRDTDRGMPLDVTGQIDGTPFDGVPALARLLVDKPDARTCYLAQWFRFSAGRLDGDGDQDFLTWLSTKFGRDTKVVDMVVSLVQSDSFRNIKLDETVGSAP